MRLSDLLGEEHPFILKQGEAIPVALNEAVRRVLQRFPEVDSSELDSDIDDLLGLMDDRRRRNDWTGIKWRHAASAARATFTPPRSLQLKWDGLRKLLLRTLDDGHKRSFAKSSFSAYLEGFDPDSDLTNRLARSLGRIWPSTLPGINRLVEQFSLFEVRGLERRIAEFIASQDQPYRALKGLGISSPHMGGLFQLAYRRFVEGQKEAIARQEGAAVEQILQWLHPDDDTALCEGQATAINALLEPWREMDPSGLLQERIRSELVHAYGDPRLSILKWGRVSEEALAVIRRWLTGLSLEQFLDVVSAVEGSHMWEPRREFWQGMYKKGLIDEAWVGLSSQGARLAREFARKSGDKGYLSHAHAHDSGSDRRCYLILRCGKGTVVEGSQNFSIRFYKSNNPNSPSLYQQTYRKYDFDRNEANAWIPHNGAWQNKAHSEIHKTRRG